MERVNEKEKEFRGKDSGVKYLIRGPKIDWGILLLKPGERMGAHLHRETEETFYFIIGSPKMMVNNVEHRATAGDAFRVEAGESHDVVNDTHEPIKAIFIKCPYLPEDKVNV